MSAPFMLPMPKFSVPSEKAAAARDLLAEARTAHGNGDLRAAAEAYRRVLLLAPIHAAAFLGLSLIARQTNQVEAALRLARASVAANPRIALAWSNLGDLLLASTVRRFGMHDPTQRKSAQLNLAQKAYSCALALDGGLHVAHFGLGNVHAQCDNFAVALPCFQRAAELAPSRAEMAFACAFAHGKLGQHRAAIKEYRRALQLSPNFASAWLNLGVELVAEGRDSLAAPCYAQAILAARKLRVDTPATELSAHLNLGHLARGRSHFLQAQASYQRAVALAVAHPHRLAEVHLAFAYLHLDRKCFPQAWISLCAAESCPESAGNSEILNTRGILLLAEHSATTPVPYTSLIEEAIAAFTAAEALGHKTAGSNRGNALLRLGRVAEALEAHQASLRREPNHPGVRYNLALTQIRSGNFAEGWQSYEIRWDFREIHPRPRIFSQPRWHGASISGSIDPEFSTGFPQNSRLRSPESSELLFYAEQGLGDTLQFIRYLPMVVERLPGVRIAVEVQSPLLRLMKASFAEIPVQFIPAGDELPQFTHHCPLMSLPAVFATTPSTVPARTPYLHWPCDAIAPAGVSHAALSIGLNWAGNSRYRADRERSTTLSTFVPLLELPDIRWVSLQKGEAARQIDLLPESIRPIDSGSLDSDLADAAAMICGLDLVITTDSAIAHLAGALGKPLWLLLPWQSDWRWMQEVESTPWYPNARLWRQSSPGDWPELIARVGAALCDRVRLSTPTAPFSAFADVSVSPSHSRV
jgi:tetratricopeptide (TPR) repeat protein